MKIIHQVLRVDNSLFNERSALDHNPVLGCNSFSYLLAHYFITQMLRPTRLVAFEAGYDVEGITAVNGILTGELNTRSSKP